jgi:hypothetical protein
MLRSGGGVKQQQTTAEVRKKHRCCSCDFFLCKGTREAKGRGEQ